MLEIRNLHKSFDGVHAVDDLSLSIEPGKITSIIGPNGAGKTTVFNIVTGFLQTDGGSISFEGKTITSLPAWKIARKGLSRTFQQVRLLKRMTVLENIMLGMQHQKGENPLAALLGGSTLSKEQKDNTAKAEKLLAFIGLSEYRDIFTENLSYGQQKLVSVACALAAEPKMLLLDEPVSGVQPEMIKLIEAKLRELSKSNITIVLIEHDMEFVMRISDTVVVMDDGKKIATGTPAEIRNNPDILKAYLS
jgi:ABC-type branched-subunit amino acid transport system ATPase component